ncbi:MAG TPA: M15 family metallopeptidase [Acidimicrobiia bacterium]
MRVGALAVVAVLMAACSDGGLEPATTGSVLPSATTTTAPLTRVPSSTTTTVAPTTTTTINPFARPDWLGTRPLPLRPDGHGEVQETPEELVDRQLETIDLLEPPLDGEWAATITPVPDDVLGRSSWVEGCPVAVDELRYVTMSHHGFDGEVHTGEMIVHVDEAKGVVEVFRRIFDAGYPIEQMRVIRQDEVDDPPTGDWNETTSFVCRPAVGSNNWSQHAFGLAIDVNPFQNPYVRDDLVIPELASAYTDREEVRAGMIFRDDVVVKAFAGIGWSWGGNWNTLKDWMHFSRSGR